MCYGKYRRQKATPMDLEDFQAIKPSAPPMPEDFEDVDNPAQMTESNFSTLEEKNNPAQTFSLEDSHGEEAQIQGASPLEQLLRDCSYEQVEDLKQEAQTVVDLLQDYQNKIKIGSKHLEEKEEEVEDVEVFQMMDKLETIRYPKVSWGVRLQRQFRRQIKRLNQSSNGIKWKLFGPKVHKSYSWTLNPGVDPTV